MFKLVKLIMFIDGKIYPINKFNLNLYNHHFSSHFAWCDTVEFTMDSSSGALRACARRIAIYRFAPATVAYGRSYVPWRCISRRRGPTVRWMRLMLRLGGSE